MHHAISPRIRPNGPGRGTAGGQRRRTTSIPAGRAARQPGRRGARKPGPADRRRAVGRACPRAPQRLRRHQRRDPAGAKCHAAAADPRNARSGRHSTPKNSDSRGHGNAPPEPRRRTGRNGRALGGRKLPHRKPSRPQARGTHVSRRKPSRAARLDRLTLRRGRPENHHRADRAALHGRFLGRAKADLPRTGRPRHRAAVARSRIPRTSQRAKRLSRWQSGSRGEHGHRADGRLRLHRERGDRRPAAHPARRGRRHGRGSSRGRRVRPRTGHGHHRRAGRYCGDHVGRLSARRHVLSDREGHGRGVADC